MTVTVSRMDAIAHGQRNYRAFYSKHIPDLLPARRGEWAVLQDEEVVAFYPTREEALTGGVSQCGNRFSIQEVIEEEPVGLGWFPVDL